MTQHNPAPPDAAIPAWLAVLKISRVPFWFLWTMPLLIGYLGSARNHGAHHVVWFVLLVVAVWVCDAAASIHNELVDREEDAINHPERVWLLAAVREKTLWRVVFAGYTILVVGGVAFVTAVGPQPALVLAAGGLVAPLYNWGPRFKRKPPLPQLVFAWVAICEVAGGWVMNAPLSTLSPIVWVVALFIAVASVSKDLPDVAGDEAVGARTIFSLRNAWLRRGALILIHVSPFILVPVLVGIGALPGRVLLVCLLLPVALIIIYLGERASTPSASILVFELAYLYVHVFLLALLICAWPSFATVTISAGMLVTRLMTVAAGLEPRFVGDTFTLRRGVQELLRSPLLENVQPQRP